ncbi:MAG TPA: MFS transporter [Anaerolineales bacterium]|nr:MFS transporter [Anaerolineales bacterium]
MNKAYPFSFYFLYYAAMAAMLPFLVLFYQQLGFTGTQIGILTGISPLIIVIGGPFWTGVADATRRHRVVMSLGIGMAVLASLSFLNLRSFWAVAAAIGLFNFFLAPVIALADGATVASLGAEREKYGRVRLGGTLGWAVSAFVAGLLIERFGLDMSFWSYAVLMFLALLVGQKFVFPQHVAGISLRQGLRHFATSRRWVLILSEGMFIGMGVVLISNYLFVYMKELGASESVMGFANTLSTLAELPVLFFAHVLLKRFGARRLMHIALFLSGLRMLLFATFNSVGGILGAQLLNGLNFPIFGAAMVTYIDQHAPAGMKSVALGLYNSVSFGLGSALGGLLGGLLLDVVGGRGMYLVCGLVTLAVQGVLVMVGRESPKDLTTEP